MRTKLTTAFIAAALTLCASAAAGGLLPSAVEHFEPGVGSGFGGGNFPANVLTGPDGGTNPPSEPSEDPANLLSLGDLGYIILRWDGDVILDGPGPDFTVFENVLITIGSGVSFIECGVVSASADGITYHTFPFRFEPPPGWEESNPFAVELTEDDYHGLAGTRPTLVNSLNGIDPGDPAVSGGDSFDLADIGLTHARYIRIDDAGSPISASSFVGTNGVRIWDLGTTISGAPAAGFDLDTVVAVNSGPAPITTVGEWLAY